MGAAGAGETLLTLPWFYSYIMQRTMMVKSVYRECARRHMPPPDPASVDYFDHAAVEDYLGQTEQSNSDYDQEVAAMIATKRRRR